MKNTHNSNLGGKNSARRISWHPAFFEAIQMELDEYADALQFIPEYQLTSEPLRIDLLIIRKTKDVNITKNIASIFRKDNIVEYKSPSDYVSVRDFYMAYAYACLHAALDGEPVTGMSLTFAASRYPRELLAHLREVRKFTVEEKRPGVYIVEGDILPIQIIDSRRLSAEENIWLKDLSDRLDAPEIQRVTAEIHRRGKAARIKAYLDVIARANKEGFKEALKMRKKVQTMEQILREVGLIAKWEAEGEARGRREGVQEIIELLKSGKPPEKIISEYGG